MRKSTCLAVLNSPLLLIALAAASPAQASTFTVDTVIDSVDAVPGDDVCADASGRCSLRAAVQEANARPNADVIVLGPGNYVLTISGNSEQNAAAGDLDILNPVTITGAGAATTVIDANGLDRVFEIVNAGDVTISGVSLQNGVAGQNAQGYFVNYAGGAIFHVGTPSILTLRDLVIRNCAATSGGAIYNVYSTLVMQNSTLYGNNATAGNGGAIAEGLADYVTLANVTITGNRATGSGGAMATSNNTATLNNVTIVDNLADSDADGNGDGGGIAQGIAAPTLSNSILAHNVDSGGQAPDCSGAITSAAYNLIGNNAGCTISTATGDHIGTPTAPLDPHLAPLADNGGSTPTRALLNGGQAWNQGSPLAPGSGSGACEPTDQRDIDRSVSTPCDIGAYEHVPGGGRDFIVNSTLDQVDATPGDGVCETAAGSGVCTLRAAIQESNALIDADRISLPAGIYSLTLIGANEDRAATGDLDISDDVTISGASATTTVIDGNHSDRIFDFHSGRTFALNALTLRNGDVLANNGSGGAIYQQSGTLTVNDSIITNNRAGYGGGLYPVAYSTLLLNRSTVSNNTATSYGGGICNFTFATTHITDSTVTGNTANRGGGLFNSFRSSTTITGSTFNNNTGSYGGALHTEWGQGSISLTNSTFSGNHAAVSGGALDITRGDDTVTLANVTLSGNGVTTTASAGGGGINSVSTSFTVRNSLIAGNTDAGTAAPDCVGSFISQGYNLLGDATGCSFTATAGDLLGSAGAPIDPRLDALVDNGGPTFTQALRADSPALNAGNPLATGSGGAACEALDQRGVDRGLNLRCDIGAAETRLADLAVAQSASADAVVVDGSITYTLTVINNSRDSASALSLIDTLPDGAVLGTIDAGSWTCDGNSPQLSCTLATLAGGQSSTVAITLSLPGVPGSRTNHVAVSSATLDLNSTDNNNDLVTTVFAAPIVTTPIVVNEIAPGFSGALFPVSPPPAAATDSKTDVTAETTVDSQTAPATEQSAPKPAEVAHEPATADEETASADAASPGATANSFVPGFAGMAPRLPRDIAPAGALLVRTAPLQFSSGTSTVVTTPLLWEQLDNMKQQMQGALAEPPLHEKIVVGAAKGVTLFLFAGTVNWMLKGSSLLAGMVSSLPLWTPFDPLAVLTLTRRERKRRKAERCADARKDDAEYRTLGTILERRRDPRGEDRP